MWILLKDNKAISIVVYDGVSELNLPAEYSIVFYEGEFDFGWEFKDGVFVAPSVTN